MMLLFVISCGLLATSALAMTPEEEARQEALIKEAIWTPVVENTRDELSRLGKSTAGYNAFATCGFSVHTDLSNYETAKQKCENNTWIGFDTPGGKRLASIHSELENKIATLMLQYAYGGEELEGSRYEGPSNWAWIGLEKVNRTQERPKGAGKLVWEEEDWLWTDNTTLNNSSYENWMTRNQTDKQIQPDMWKVESSHQTAARLYRQVAEAGTSGVWDDTFKSKLHPYICKFNFPVHYIVFPELKSWHDARADCERRGFYFAKIRNMAENRLFKEAVQRVYQEDVHDKKFHHENWIWIGATDLKDSQAFEFYDGEPIQFTPPWAKKQHDNKTTKKQGSQDYIAVSRWGEWDDSYGNDWDRPYACQCNPHGIAIDKEMADANAAWDTQTKIRNAAKKKKKEERRKARKEAKEKRKRAREARKKARKEMKQKKKEERRQRKQEKGQKKAARKQEKQSARKAKKGERKAKKAARKADRKEDKAEKQENKATKKAEKKVKKADKQENKAAKKAVKEAKKAEKADRKADKKANKAEKKAKKAAEKEEKKGVLPKEEQAASVEMANNDQSSPDTSKQEVKSDRKGAKAAKKVAKADRKAAKKDAKADRKAAKKTKKGDGNQQGGVEIEKRQLQKRKSGRPPLTPGKLEKREAAGIPDHELELEVEVEKRQWLPQREKRQFIQPSRRKRKKKKNRNGNGM